MSQVYTRFQTKTVQKPTLWGGTHLYGLLCIGEYPPGVIPRSLNSDGKLLQLTKKLLKNINHYY